MSFRHREPCPVRRSVPEVRALDEAIAPKSAVIAADPVIRGEARV